jgi:hypothetical protein
MRRAFGIAAVASLALLMPVIAQIGGRPMVLIAGQVLGPATFVDPQRNFVMLSGARLAPNPNAQVNAEMEFGAFNISEEPGRRITHGAIFFRFRVVPPPPPTPSAMIQIVADGGDANVQTRRFMATTVLQGGGTGTLVVFRARVRRYDRSNPPQEVEQQGIVVLMIQDFVPSASQRPNPNTPPDQVALIPNLSEQDFARLGAPATYPYTAGLTYIEGAQYIYEYTGVVREGDIYTHGRYITPSP